MKVLLTHRKRDRRADRNEQIYQGYKEKANLDRDEGSETDKETDGQKHINKVIMDRMNDKTQFKCRLC